MVFRAIGLYEISENNLCKKREVEKDKKNTEYKRLIFLTIKFIFNIKNTVCHEDLSKNSGLHFRLSLVECIYVQDGTSKDVTLGMRAVMDYQLTS